MHESKSTQAAKQSKKQKQPQGHDDDVPKKNTVYDFWSMVIQEDVDTIVMLCELKVGDCIKYWPDSKEISVCCFLIYQNNRKKNL